MRKFLIGLFLLSGLSVSAAEPIRVAPNMYYVKGAVLEDQVLTCYARINTEQAVLNGKVFTLEYNCMHDYGGEIEFTDSYFYYDWDYNKFVKGKPYYFGRKEVQTTAIQYEGVR